MIGYDHALKYGKKTKFLIELYPLFFGDDGFLNLYLLKLINVYIFYSFFITYLLFLRNILQKPNIQKFKNTFSTVAKLLTTSNSGHKHSPGDVN